MGGLGLFDYNEELESCDVSSRLNFVFVRLNFVFCSCSPPWLYNLSQSYSQVDDLIPDDFPRGPWLSAEDAKLEINLYCIDPLTGGGGWAVSWHGLDTKYYSPASSHWRRIRCANRHDPAGKGQGFRPFAVESDGQPARAAMRAGIPDEFMILGEQLRHAALPAGTINDILVLIACASGL